MATKYLLPLIALGLLSMLVFLARSAPEGEPLRFVDQAIEDLAKTQRLGTPRYSAVTDDGGELSITADALVPDTTREHVTLGETMAATLAMPDGVFYDMTADHGILDEPAMQSTLQDNVVVVSSDGAVMRTDALRMRNDRSYLETLAPVQIDGPDWWITSDRMEIFTDPKDEFQTRMVFTGDVRLLYTP